MSFCHPRLEQKRADGVAEAGNVTARVVPSQDAWFERSFTFLTI